MGARVSSEGRSSTPAGLTPQGQTEAGRAPPGLASAWMWLWGYQGGWQW